MSVKSLSTLDTLIPTPSGRLKLKSPVIGRCGSLVCPVEIPYVDEWQAEALLKTDILLHWFWYVSSVENDRTCVIKTGHVVYIKRFDRWELVSFQNFVTHDFVTLCWAKIKRTVEASIRRASVYKQMVYDYPPQEKKPRGTYHTYPYYMTDYP